MQLPPLAPGESFDPFEERKITLLMVAGGHFAGMVVSLRPLNLAQGKGLKPERQEVKGAGEVRVLKHKTFHRYTSESRRLCAARMADISAQRERSRADRRA